MEQIGLITIYGLIFGMLGTTFGGVVGAILNIKSKKILSFILEFASGLMMAIICFDLIPESLRISNITSCLIGIIIGVISMIICDEFINKINFIKDDNKDCNLYKTGMIVCIGLAVHNFPERISYRLRF